MSVVPLHKPAACENIPATLRLVADEIESGEYSDWPITTAILICAHEKTKPEGDDIVMSQTFWRTHSIGPRSHESFVVRGILATVLHRGFDGDDE